MKKVINIALISVFLFAGCTTQTVPEPSGVNGDVLGVDNSDQKPRPVIAETKSNCHPSYSRCLNPDASDYDCAGGSGNGPYSTGKVQVIGPDVFGLDRDSDGWGCE